MVTDLSQLLPSSPTKALFFLHPDLLSVCSFLFVLPAPALAQVPIISDLDLQTSLLVSQSPQSVPSHSCSEIGLIVKFFPPTYLQLRCPLSLEAFPDTPFCPCDIVSWSQDGCLTSVAQTGREKEMWLRVCAHTHTHTRHFTAEFLCVLLVKRRSVDHPMGKRDWEIALGIPPPSPIPLD